jgi:hypothetical protein
LVPDGEGFAAVVAFAVAEPLADAPVDAFAEPDVLAVVVAFAVLGLTGGLAAVDVLPGLDVTGGVAVTAGLLVFGEVCGDEVGEPDTAGQDAAAPGTLLDVTFAPPVAPPLDAPAAALPS